MTEELANRDAARLAVHHQETWLVVHHTATGDKDEHNSRLSLEERYHTHPADYYFHPYGCRIVRAYDSSGRQCSIPPRLMP